METSQGKNQVAALPGPEPKRKGKVGRVFGFIGLGLLILIVIVLLVNAILNIFLPHYYPTFGNYRLFAVVTDSMDPTIPRGHMIVDEKPTSLDDIKADTVITFEVVDKDGNVTMLLTHRVVSVNTDAATSTVYFVTKGDNADGNDNYHATYEDVVGIYTGKHCGFFGYLFGFLQSENGAVSLIFMLFILIIMWIVLYYIGNSEKRRKRDNAALQKGAKALSDVNLRYDNIREITAVMDVIGMITEEPKTLAESREIDLRLNEFIKAETIELPKTPEAAAILDSLPAPDTPVTLAAALREGATLRQAEDGQLLVMTSLSGGKSILLSPVQTAEGIMLSQQGVRLKSDIAPNIEDVGVTSMPQYPGFFESAAAADSKLASTDSKQVQQLDDSAYRARLAYAHYRETASALEREQAEELSKLLGSVTPIGPEDQERIKQYRKEQKEQKAKKPPVEKTPEQIAAQKARADKRKELAAQKKAEEEAFLATLAPEDRELYLSEQKLAKSRAATIRRLKRMNSDKRILEKMSSAK
ncbi:MAG: signal peptidase I [Clostridiales bacterium]|nr:signal peptidase I [Clostridiales bacterium]